MILFKAENEQIYQMYRHAFIAAEPIGMGKLHYSKDHDLSPGYFLEFIKHKQRYSADYVMGRMLKIYLTRDGEEWVINRNANSADTPTAEYQSWVSKYPTWQSLLDTGGITGRNG